MDSERITAEPNPRPHPEPPSDRQRDSLPTDAIPVATTTVAQIMGRHAVSIDSDATPASALQRMRQHDVHHLLVEDQGQFVGVISDRALLQHLSPFIGKVSEQRRDAWTLERCVFQITTYAPTTVSADGPL